MPIDSTMSCLKLVVTNSAIIVSNTISLPSNNTLTVMNLDLCKLKLILLSGCESTTSCMVDFPILLLMSIMDSMVAVPEEFMASCVY